MAILQDLQPRDVFHYFEEISAVPRPSGYPEAIGDYCEAFAKEHALRCVRDAHGNVVLFKDGDSAKEPVILQGHLDMVCVSEPDVEINFRTDALPLATDGKYVFCNGTSLGADDGIAVAMILAVLASDTRDLPPIEAVFTMDEETSMVGAAGLDVSVLRGRRMINLDSEAEGTFWVSCAGGVRALVTREVQTERYQDAYAYVKLSGLRGGHSGTEIDKGRLNAVVCMAQCLQEVPGLRLCCMSGGTVDNAIPSECFAVFAGSIYALGNAFRAHKEAWQETEPDMEVGFLPPSKSLWPYSIPSDLSRQLFAGPSSSRLLTEESTRDVLRLLTALPNGVQAYSREIEGFVETSLNLGVCRVDATGAELHYSLRSGVDAERDALVERVKKITAENGGKCETSGAYPAWQYRENSPLRDTAVRAFEARFGYTPKIEGIHAGLECGLFSGKIADLDCISLGPDIFDIHSTKERLSVSSAARTYALLWDVLKQL